MHSLSSQQVKAMLLRAEEKAAEINVFASITIVDAGGHLLGFARMDNAAPGPVEVSINKARTAALFRRESGEFGKVARERPLTGIELTHGGLALFNGGVPISCQGIALGGIGVAGGTADQDLEIARFALELLA